MKPIFYLIIVFLFFFSCSFNKKQNTSISPQSTNVLKDVLADTLIKPFKSSLYNLKITCNTQLSVKTGNNTSAIFSKNKQTIFIDSLHCDFLEIDKKDMNNDGIDDILIFHSSGGRANPTYYLYLVDSINFKLNSVKGFENLPNPDIDGDIITSVALAGISYKYKFFRIEKGILINLGHSFETDIGDSKNRYNTVINFLKTSRSY